MPKGRHCNPCTRNDGQWFPHLDVQEPTFTAVLKSTKGKCIAMQENSFSPIQLNDRLPLLFKVSEKGDFPFSAHDNKYSLRHTGDYLDLGLGRKKVSGEKQTVHSVELWDPRKASMMNSRFGITIYQTSYLGSQDTEHPNYRRYPKIPSESSQMAQSQNSADLMWFGKNNSRYRIPMEVLGITQRSPLPTDKKFYRTRFLPK